MRIDQLLANPHVQLDLADPKVTPNERKGHGLLRCTAHLGCIEIRRAGGSRQEPLLHEARMYHPDALLAVTLAPTAACYDIDSAEGWAQLRAAGARLEQLTLVRTPGRNRAHAYGTLPGRETKPRPSELLGTDLRHGRMQYTIAPGQRRGDGGVYGGVTAAKWRKWGALPKGILNPSGDHTLLRFGHPSDPSEWMQYEGSSVVPPTGSDIGACKRPFGKPAPRKLEHAAAVLQAKWLAAARDSIVEEWTIGYEDRALDWRLDDWWGEWLTPAMRRARAVVIQTAMRHRKLVVDIGVAEVGTTLGISARRAAYNLNDCIRYGALVVATDTVAVPGGWVYDDRAPKFNRVRGLAVAGLAVRVTDRPAGRRAVSVYARRKPRAI